MAVVGAGAGALLAELLDAGYTQLTAVDIAQPALDQLAERLGERSALVTMRCADVRTVRLDQPVRVWHDRATFHFLTDPADQAAYVERAAASVSGGGHAIISTFAGDGPEQCSGLNVARYDPAALAEVFAGPFELVDTGRELHRTPWGAEQPFTIVTLRRR